MRSEDYDAMQQNLHVGLKMISFPTDVYNVLKEIGLPTYEERIREMTDIDTLSDEMLTKPEQEMIEILKAIDDYLPFNRLSGVRVYERKFIGQRVAPGFSDGINVHLLRDVLKDFQRAADVYVHEKAHHNTGAQDASMDYRNYLTLALSRIAVERLREVRPDLLKNGE